MPTWGELLLELKGIDKQELPEGVSQYDYLRRKYLNLLHKHTGNAVIAYVTDWTSGGSSPSSSINTEDVQAFMEVVHGMEEDSLDLILHSPGGSPEATEVLVHYLRQKFRRIRVFVPQAAMSAATMLACAADEIVMGRHSSLGPIDPQMIVRIEGQMIAAPAAAIKEQFQTAQRECQDDPSKLPSWIPILRQYGPALLAQCRFAEELSETLVATWLKQYMFAGDPDAERKGKEIAENLADHAEFKTHSRFIPREKAEAYGLKVVELEADQQLQDLVLTVFHAVTITLTGTATVKVVENHKGKSYIKSEQKFLVQSLAAQRPQPASPPTPTKSAPQSKSRKNKKKRKN